MRQVPPWRRAYFFLCGQEKVAKKKATPGSVPAAPVPCATRTSRGLRNSGLRPSDSARPFSAKPCVARHLPRGPENSWGLRGCRVRFDFCPFLAVDRNRPCSRLPVEPRRRSAPLRGAEQRRRAGGSWLALSEPQASSCETPGSTSSARDRAQPDADPGVAFSLATFFWRSKRKYARASGAETNASEERSPPKINLDNPLIILHAGEIPLRQHRSFVQHGHFPAQLLDKRHVMLDHHQ